MPSWLATAAVAYWLERPLREPEVVGSKFEPKSLKLIVVTFPILLRIKGITLRLARQCRYNGLVKYWLKIV